MVGRYRNSQVDLRGGRPNIAYFGWKMCRVVTSMRKTKKTKKNIVANKFDKHRKSKRKIVYYGTREGKKCTFAWFGLRVWVGVLCVLFFSCLFLGTKVQRKMNMNIISDVKKKATAMCIYKKKIEYVE
jgi:hypothetical protein